MNLPILQPELIQLSHEELITEIVTLRKRNAALEAQQTLDEEQPERKWLDISLQDITAATAASTGQEFLTILAKHLSLALQIRHAVITELINDELQTLAFWSDGQAQPPTAFPLSEAPCCSLSMKVGGYQCLRGLQQQFQGYQLLASLEGESYIGVPLRDSEGRSIGNICVIHDRPIKYPQQVEAILRIFAARASVELERQRSADVLQKSLAEKEVLLQEIHHRVKNNLQTVCSLLRLQANTIKDSQALEQLRESQNRVHAMGLIHEKLYQSKNLAQINFAEYLQSLVEDLFNSYNADRHRVNVRFDVVPVRFCVDIANPCGLILNELVSNVLKHAFPDDRPGTIQISLQRTASQYALTVQDDGIGLPPDLNVNQTRSLGLRLVRSLVQQLKGTLTVEGQQGTRFVITFAVE